MQLNRCPICHSRISVDALVQDEAGRELMALLVRCDTESGSALVSYLGLFRTAQRDLANDRALKLAKEALGLTSDLGRIAQAMRTTVDNLRESPVPLKNHNYLKKVLAGTEAVGTYLPVSAAVPVVSRVVPAGPTSKTTQALNALEDWANG